MSALDPFALISRVISGQLSRPESAASTGADTTPSCFVAVGDSFTAGTGCEPGQAWADRIAAGLGAPEGELAYRNLAVDGATSSEVAEQVRAAIEFEPDLVSIICGTNDVLRSTRPDPVAYATRLAAMFRRLRASGPGVRVITATAPETWDFLPLGPRTRARVERGVQRFNQVTRRVADLHGVPYLEVAGHAGLSERANFADDGLHPSALGHARTALALAQLLSSSYGIEPRLEGLEEAA